METRITTDLIMGTIKDWVETKHPIGPEVWVDACAKLNILIGDENAKLFDLQQEVAKLKVGYMEEGDSAVKAKIKTEAHNTYKEMCIQRGKIEQITEQIRISKIQARLSSDEMRGQ